MSYVTCWILLESFEPLHWFIWHEHGGQKDKGVSFLCPYFLALILVPACRVRTIDVSGRGKYQTLRKVKESFYISLEAKDPRAWRCAFEALYPVALKNASNGSGAMGLEDSKELALEAVSRLFTIVEERRFRSRWVGLEKEEVLAQMGAMVAVIARRLKISSNRKHFSSKRQGRNLHTSLDESLLSADSGYKMLELADALRVLRKVMDANLETLERDLLQDYYLEGLTLKEISLRHGLPLGSVGTKIGRILLKLRKQVEEEGVSKDSLTYFLREEETLHPTGSGGHE